MLCATHSTANPAAVRNAPPTRCVSGQTGRFVYKEQAALGRFFPSLDSGSVRVDAFIVLVDSGSDGSVGATVASNGDVAPVPYLNQMTCFRALEQPGLCIRNSINS